MAWPATPTIPEPVLVRPAPCSSEIRTGVVAADLGDHILDKRESGAEISLIADRSPAARQPGSSVPADRSAGFGSENESIRWKSVLTSPSGAGDSPSCRTAAMRMRASSKAHSPLDPPEAYGTVLHRGLVSSVD